MFEIPVSLLSLMERWFALEGERGGKKERISKRGRLVRQLARLLSAALHFISGNCFLFVKQLSHFTPEVVSFCKHTHTIMGFDFHK